MLAIERVWRWVRAIPAASALGLGLFGVAAVVEIASRLAGTDAHAAHHAVHQGHTSHLLVLAGMVLVLAGVVVNGARRHHSRGSAAATTGGLERNAPR